MAAAPTKEIPSFDEYVNTNKSWHLMQNSPTVITNTWAYYIAIDALQIISLLKMSVSPQATRNNG